MGNKHTCVIIDNGEIWCWGNNHHNQLGNSTTCYSNCEALDAVKVDQMGVNSTFAISISSSYATNCAVLANGSLFCWGYNGRGEVGLGWEHTTGGDNRVALGFPDRGNRSARAVSMGRTEVHVILMTGRSGAEAGISLRLTTFGHRPREERVATAVSVGEGTLVR